MNIIKMIRSRPKRWLGCVTCLKPEINTDWREETYWRPKHRWEVNIKMDVKETGWKCADCVVGNEPLCAIKYGWLIKDMTGMACSIQGWHDKCI